MSIGKSRLGRQSPYQLGLSRPPRPKKSIIGRSMRISGFGHADLHDGAGEVAGVERLLEHLRVADRLDAHVGAVAVGERLDGLDRVGRSTRRRCGWRRTPWPARASGRRGRRR